MRPNGRLRGLGDLDHSLSDMGSAIAPFHSERMPRHEHKTRQRNKTTLSARRIGRPDQAICRFGVAVGPAMKHGASGVGDILELARSLKHSRVCVLRPKLLGATHG